ncbi:MAG: RsiV family protein, partial [Lachnospiraceae bacterium]|nr:RsiV family protein [Lachnospiraceae bacterium]
MKKMEFNNEFYELEKSLSRAGADYKNISVPNDLEKKLEKVVKRAKRIHRFCIPAAAAAAMLTLVILPNTGAGVAYAMGNIPVVGRIFQAVTFRNYQYEDGRFIANVQIPQITLSDIGMETASSKASSELNETIKQVNFDIERMTEELVAEFEASAALGESYNDLEIHHETVTDNGRYFAIRLFIYQGAGSGTQSYQIYTIDKLSGRQIQLKDLFLEGSDFNTRLSENIREQMREAMAEDAGKAYWVDREENPGMNWKGVNQEQNFNIDADNNLV